MATYRSADGTVWRVKVSNVGASNAIVLFQHPDGESTRKDRYNWYLSKGPEAKSVTGRLDPKKVADSLNSEEVELLFRRSMPVSRHDQLSVSPNLAVKSS
ncbi:MAG: hypothetical protein ACJ79K_00160 [Gemmatimonadaceae bacterium]